MKELQSLNGGYKRHMDYLLTLQSEVLGVQNALFKNLGHDLVLSGCEVTDNNNGTVSIAPGVVYVAGEICRFAGANNITSNGTKALSKGAPVATDPDVFFDDLTKNVYKETFAVVSNTANAAVQIVIKTALYDMRAYISDIVQSYGQKGEIKDIYDLDGTFLSNFDNTGVGTTPRWIGWHLVNGSGGAPDFQGRVRVTAGKIVSDGIEYTFTHGDLGGTVKHKLSTLEGPKHDHLIASENGEISTGQKLQASGPYRFLERFFNSLGDRNYTLTGNSKTPDVGRTSESGTGAAHNNMQPHVNVYTVIRMT